MNSYSVALIVVIMYHTSKIDLTIPSLLNEEALTNLSTNQKRDYIRRVLEKIFDLNRERQEGITISELESILPFGMSSIRNTLREMLAVRQIYAVKGHDGRLLRYHANGRICHSFKHSIVRLGSATYKVILLLNNQKLQVFLQEKRIDRYGGERHSGGLIIDASDFPEFVSKLSKMAAKIEYEGEVVKNQVFEMIQ